MVTRKARVLMLVTELSMGGAAKVVREVSAMLAQRFEVHEAVFNAADGIDFPGQGTPYSLDVSGGGGVLTKILNFGRRIIRTRRLKEELGVDVCISHLEGAHYVDALSRGREKIVLCVHGSMIRDHEAKGVGEWLRRRLVIPRIYGRADRIVTVSRDIVPQMVKLGLPPEKITTINNSFDVASIWAQSREPLTVEEQALFGTDPVLVTVGRLAKQKNHRPLLEIFADLRQRRSCKLILLGDGELRSTLVKTARRLGLRVYQASEGAPLEPDFDVYFLGNQDNPHRLVGRADLFVLPSTWEGFPLALCEAMICGTPVVSTDCVTGPREILGPRTVMPDTPIAQEERGEFGILMPTLHDPKTIASARTVWVETLDRLLSDRPERQRLAAAGKARSQDFRRENVAVQWTALVEELVREAQ